MIVDEIKKNINNNQPRQVYSSMGFGDLAQARIDLRQVQFKVPVTVYLGGLDESRTNTADNITILMFHDKLLNLKVNHLQ